MTTPSHLIVAIAQVRDRLDGAYLDRWATDLGIPDLLARARRETAG